MAIYFYFGLSTRTFEVMIIPVVKFLVNIREHKRIKTLVIRHLGYSKNP